MITNFFVGIMMTIFLVFFVICHVWISDAFKELEEASKPNPPRPLTPLPKYVHPRVNKINQLQK